MKNEETNGIRSNIPNPTGWELINSGLWIPKQKDLLSSLKQYSDLLDFFWEHSKRISIISVVTGQFMLIYFYGRNGIAITDLSNYLVASLEAYVVFLVSILIVSYYILFPSVHFGSWLKNKSWGLNLIIYVFYSVLPDLVSYYFTNSYVILGIIIIFIVAMNSIFLGAAKNNVSSREIAMPVIYAVPFACLFIYCLFPTLQNILMTGIGILEKPYLTLVKNESNAESEIKTMENAYPNRKPEQVKFGGYVGYCSSSLIYEGNGIYKLSLPIKAENKSISVSVHSRNLLAINSRLGNNQEKKYLQNICPLSNSKFADH
jgi:hypothetical protein